MLQLGEPFLAQLTQSLCSHCLAVFSDIFVNSPESRTTVHWQNDECGATQNSGCSDAGKAQKLKAPYKASFKAPDNSTLARKDFQPIPHHTSLSLTPHCHIYFSIAFSNSASSPFNNNNNNNNSSILMMAGSAAAWCGRWRKENDAVGVPAR